MLKLKSIPFITLILMTTTLGAAPVWAQKLPQKTDSLMSQALPTTLALSETTEVRSTPDIAFINFGITTEAKTAEAALGDNARKMTTVMTALKAQGIMDKHVQTSGLSLNTVYDYPPNKPAISKGYQVSNRINVRVSDVAKLGPTIDAVVKAGINQIDGISFGLKDPSTAEDKARSEATRTLMGRADIYAKALGLKVKRVLSVSENAAFNSGPPMMMQKQMLVQTSADTPIAAGEVATTLSLNMVIELE
jgi:uncharacterized protein